MCSVLGILVKQKAEISDAGVVHCPFSLFPTPIPQDALKQGLLMQPLLAQVVAGIINNHADNIEGILKDFSKHDDFMTRLLKVSHDFNHLAGPRQNIHMCILRPDYLLDFQDDKYSTIKLVEYNTIACGMGVLTDKV